MRYAIASCTAEWNKPQNAQVNGVDWIGEFVLIIYSQSSGKRDHVSLASHFHSAPYENRKVELIFIFLFFFDWWRMTKVNNVHRSRYWMQWHRCELCVDFRWLPSWFVMFSWWQFCFVFWFMVRKCGCKRFYLTCVAWNWFSSFTSIGFIENNNYFNSTLV